MNFINTGFEGVFLIESKILKDRRGEFQKLFQKSIYFKKGIDINIDEHFFSVSHKGVIRGMHFQLPPHGQEKLVYVLQGEILDAVVDLRPDSNTFKEVITVNLSSMAAKALFIPKGLAHGFQSLKDNTITVYLQSEEYNSESDSGISPLSINVDWPVKNYFISEKDKDLISLKKFESPF